MSSTLAGLSFFRGTLFTVADLHRLAVCEDDPYAVKSVTSLLLSPTTPPGFGDPLEDPDAVSFRLSADMARPRMLGRPERTSIRRGVVFVHGNYLERRDGRKWSLVIGNALIEMFSFLIC